MKLEFFLLTGDYEKSERQFARWAWKSTAHTDWESYSETDHSGSAQHREEFSGFAAGTDGGTQEYFDSCHWLSLYLIGEYYSYSSKFIVSLISHRYLLVGE